MGTRSGDLDPAIVNVISTKEGFRLRKWKPCSTRNPVCSGFPD